jgi:hypothetical protein
MMNDYDVNACMVAFSKLCEDAERSELVSAEECQYWVFESGYQAAMAEMIKIIKAGQIEKPALSTAESIINRLALH